MTGSIIPLPRAQIVDQNGAPLVGATISTYVPGTTTPAPTFLDQTLTVQNQNPIVTDALGMFVAWGAADFRYIVHDAQGNLIYDDDTSSPLAASTISNFMLPVVGASNSTQFLDLSGTTAFVDAAIAGVSTIVGPTGPAGPQGVAGATGPTGPTGAPGMITISSNINGTYVQWKTPQSWVVQYGNGVTDPSGNCTVTFPLAFPTNFQGAVVAMNGPNWDTWISWAPQSNSTMLVMQRIAGGGGPGQSIGFGWTAWGN